MDEYKTTYFTEFLVSENSRGVLGCFLGASVPNNFIRSVDRLVCLGNSGRGEWRGSYGLSIINTVTLF